MNNGGGGTLADFEASHIRDEALDIRRFAFLVGALHRQPLQGTLRVTLNIKVIPNRFHQDPRGFNQTLDVEGIQVILDLYVDKPFRCFHTLVFSVKRDG
jgi:hypothetical protein